MNNIYNLKTMKLKIVFFVLLFSFISNLQAKDWTIDVIVAQDGSGDYATITEALNANPDNGSDFVIYIKNGIYNEKIFITQNNITLLGEDRDSTIITQSILRRIWLESHTDDWGVATINIASAVTDLTLANLTVKNNFADLNPDMENNHDHTMAIRGGGNRIIIVNCNIIATGGDTLSLWNTDGGMFYHSGCFFEGYVDYVCPRGYCYISNSDFYGYNGSASIWHDGSGGKDHKFVVKNSYFDGVKDFALGRFHRMAAFYLLECDFTANLRDNGGILYVGDSLKNDRDKLIYGIRTYYYRCNRETGDYTWHSDNLSTAEGSPSPTEITDTWTFNNSWNPEKEITGLLECAFLPVPGYRAKKVNPTPTLSWLPGKDAVSHLIYFGTDPNPAFLTETTDTSYEIKNDLEGATRYYWRIDEITENDTITGAVWTFITEVTDFPAQVSNPFPPVDTNFFRSIIYLDWDANTFEVDSFLVYFGPKDSLQLVSTQTNVGYTVYNASKKTYYWRVDAKNAIGLTEGPLWYFNNYKPVVVSSTDNFSDDVINFKVFPNPAKDNFTLAFSISQQTHLSLSIINLQGKVLVNQDLGNYSRGKYIYDYNPKNKIMRLSPGQYIIQLKSDYNSVVMPLYIY